MIEHTVTAFFLPDQTLDKSQIPMYTNDVFFNLEVLRDPLLLNLKTRLFEAVKQVS